MRTKIRRFAAAEDIDALAKIPTETLMLRRAEAAERIETRENRALSESRNYTEREQTLNAADAGEASAIDAALVIAERSASQVERRSALHTEIDRLRGARTAPRGHSPLLVSETNLRSHAAAIRAGSAFGAVEELEVEERATVTVASDMGSPGAWEAGQIRQPVTLRAFAGIPNAPLTGATAQMPSVTFPTAAAGVAEGTQHGEYDLVDVANLTTLRYGRWTTVTSFVSAFDQLEVINRSQAVGIARDLNLLDVTAIQTAAGTVTAFSASLLDQNVRTAIMKVAAAALCDPQDVVLFGTSIALGVVNGYAPANGDDRGSVSTRIYGARVYVTESALAGNVYAFAPSGFQTFSDRLQSASTTDPKNGGPTYGQWLHSTGPGLAIVGAAAGVDCVTP
jgi:hypothetical protein